VTKTLARNPSDREAVKAIPDRAGASDAKRNHPSALFVVVLLALPTTVWAQYWAHSARFSIGPCSESEKSATGRRFS